VRGEQQILAFNRGMISRLAMARVDLKRYPMSAEEQTNFIPRVLGSAMLRPGLGYLGATRSNLAAKYLDFIFSSDDAALLELTDQTMRVWVNDALVTRPSVSTVVANGTFDTNLTSWTDIAAGLAVSTWVTGGHMGLTGDAGDYAGRRQAVAVDPGDRGVVHALRVVVARGVVDVLVGSNSGGEEYFRVTLGRGVHSLAFTPTTDISIDIISFTEYQSLVDSCTIESAGVLTLPTPWLEADLPMIRKDQSGDVLFVACNGYQQRRIERRGTTSWSVAAYEPENGPYRATNVSKTTISNTAIRGITTLTASQAVFKAGHVGAIFRLESNGQDIDRSFTALNHLSDKIIVTGVGDARDFSIVMLFGVAVGTVTLQRSVGDTEVWEDTASSYTADTTATFNDTLDNQIVAYRLKCTAYTSGTIDGQLRYRYGSITGVVRILSVSSPTSASAIVLKTLGNLGSLGNSATMSWAEGQWSDYRGWPSAVCLYEGRLWWAGKDKWLGSVTDDFANFDPEYEGDAGPIIRSIGSGPVDTINWLLPLQRLVAGTDGSVIAGRSNSFDEPLTPTNFNPKAVMTQGVAQLPAVKLDDTALFVQRGGYRVLSMAPSIESNSNYAPEDVSMLVPDIGKPGIVSLCVQRQPDTRVHCVRSDGKVAVMIYDKTEDVKCWVLVETDGLVEDAVVLPGENGEEAVYYLVNRTIGGSTVRYLERWAREDESIGGAISKLADSFVTYNGSNLDHLEGESVVGWYAGVAYDAVTVIGGAAVGMPVGAIVGLAYEARFKSTRLAYLAAPGESGLPSRKRSHSLALVLADTHAQGVQYGKDFDTMDDLPLMEGYQEVDPDSVWAAYNYESFSLPGEWEVDSRLCLKAAAPRPCTLLAAIPGLSANATT
jgi:hypothetical protein